MMAFVVCGLYAFAAVVSVFVRRALGQRPEPEEGEEGYYEGGSEEPRGDETMALTDAPSPTTAPRGTAKRRGKKKIRGRGSEKSE